MNWNKSAEMLGALADETGPSLGPPDPEPVQPKGTCNWCWDPLPWWRRMFFLSWCRICSLDTPSPPKPSGRSKALAARREAAQRNAAGMRVIGDRQPPVEDEVEPKACACLLCVPARPEESTTTWCQADPPVKPGVRDMWIDAERQAHAFHDGAWVKIDRYDLVV